MTVFNDYALYYNLLYHDKDYSGEAAFILDILKKHGSVPRTLLDLGCGTGKHAVEMSKHGIQVTGVDMSQTMLDMGSEYIKDSVPLPKLIYGDAKTVRLDAKFDTVTSLFHVMSYQNTEEDALALMQTAKEHLKPGGIFLFDFWYGPGVLTDPPVKREKIMEDDNTKITRYATPVHRVNDNIVEVHYDIELIDKKNGNERKLSECHNMRYWFIPELKYLAKQAGFSVVCSGGWLSEKEPAITDWNAWMLLKCE